MKKIIIPFLMLLGSSLAWASDGPRLDKAGIDLHNEASLQRGARIFVNYCQGCHSLKYQRYQRMADDIGLTHDEVKDNMIFGDQKIGDTMTSAIHPEDAEGWFGTAPPDLSVITRARGVDWIYTYMRSFYIDEKRPFGVNNTVFPDVGMPHVLWEMQGMQKANFSEEKDSDGNVHKVFKGFEAVTPGTMDPAEFDNAMRDLTAFLSYVGEPAQLVRKQIGVYVILFLFIFTVLAYLLKKEYWKDVH